MPTCHYLSDISQKILSSTSKRQHKQHNIAFSLFFSQDTHTHTHRLPEILAFSVKKKARCHAVQMQDAS